MARSMMLLIIIAAIIFVFMIAMKLLNIKLPNFFKSDEDENFPTV